MKCGHEAPGRRVCGGQMQERKEVVKVLMIFEAIENRQGLMVTTIAEQQ